MSFSVRNFWVVAEIHIIWLQIVMASNSKLWPYFLTESWVASELAFALQTEPATEKSRICLLKYQNWISKGKSSSESCPGLITSPAKWARPIVRTIGGDLLPQLHIAFWQKVLWSCHFLLDYESFACCQLNDDIGSFWKSKLRALLVVKIGKISKWC